MIRRILQRLSRRLGQTPISAPAEPCVSVVIPTYNVAQYLDECLNSVLDQSLRELEIIVVDDGSTDSTVGIARGVAGRDPRVTVLTQAHAGQGAARNRGVAVATGRYLAFVDGDDLVPRDAYARMVAMAEESASDFVLGPVVRLKPDGRLSPPGWHAQVFDRLRRGVTIEDFPTAMFDVLACNRLFRREFWRREVGGFPSGVAYEDHVPMVRAYLRARAFDVLPDPVYWWRIRADATSTRQQKHQLHNLRDRIAVKREALTLITAEALPAVRSAWLARVLDLDLASYLRPALLADSEYRQVLALTFAEYLGLADDAALNQIRVVFRLAAQLAADGRWDLVEGLLRRADASGGELPTELVEDGLTESGLYVAASELAELGIALPRRLGLVGELQSRVAVCLSDLRWVAGELRLEGWATVPLLDTFTVVPELTARLVDLDNPDTDDLGVTLAVEHRRTEMATFWSKAHYARSDGGGFALRIDPQQLASVGGVGRWQLRLALQVEGVHREGAVRFAQPGSLAALDRLPHHLDPGATREMQPEFDLEHGFVLRLRAPTRLEPSERDPAEPRVSSVDSQNETLAVRLSAAEARGGVLKGAVTTVRAASTDSSADAGHTWRFPLRTQRFGTDVPLPAGVYHVATEGADQLSWGRSDVPVLPLDEVTGDHRVRVESSASGAVRVRLSAPLTAGESSGVEQQRLRERFRASGGQALHDRVLIVGTRSEARADLVALADDLLSQDRRPSVHWEYLDPAVQGPQGTEAVVYRSRVWHELLGTSRVVVSGHPLPRWLALVPGQQRIVIIGPKLAQSVPTGTSTIPLGRPRLEGLRRADRTEVRNRVRSRLGIGLDDFVLLTGATRRRELQRRARLSAVHEPRLLVTAGAWTRLPDATGVTDATGWPRPWELLLAADEVDLDTSLAAILAVAPLVPAAEPADGSGESPVRWVAGELIDAMLDQMSGAGEPHDGTEIFDLLAGGRGS